MDRSRYREDRNDRSDRDRYRQDSPVRGSRYRSRSRSRDRDRGRDKDRDRNTRDTNTDRVDNKSYERNRGGGDIRNYHDQYTDKIDMINQTETQEKQKSRNPNDNNAIPTDKMEIIGKTTTQEEETPDEDELKAMESFMKEDDEGEESEEKLEERLLMERKKRRQEILSKHENTNTQIPANNLLPAKLISQPSELMEDEPPSHSFMSNPVHTALQALVKEEGEELVILGRNYENEAFRQLEAEKSALEAEDVGSKRYSTTFDIFSSSPSDLERELRRPGAAQTLGNTITDHMLHDSEDPHLQSNWDDAEGYYRTRVGEVILDRYRTLGVVGKGVFSTVIKCADITKPVRADDQVITKPPALGPALGGLISESKFECVAIKMIRNNDTMRKAADKELAILTLLSKNDPTNKKHCVTLLERFEFRRHIALVFEYQPMNLREILKKFGKDVGINVGAIRLYARQLLVALRYLLDLKIVHADIKLDNILCSSDLKQVKLCDFGSAFFENDPESVPTPYLVSRFYRAPEIILGQPCTCCILLYSILATLIYSIIII